MPFSLFCRPLEKPSRIWYIYTRFNTFFKNLKGKLRETSGRPDVPMDMGSRDSDRSKSCASEQSREPRSNRGSRAAVVKRGSI